LRTACGLLGLTAGLLTLLLFAGCDEAEQEPSYLQLNGINFQVGQNEGAATQDIATIWVFLGNDFLGAYRLNARIPLLESGLTDVRFEFGVQENGVSATPNIYEFYAPVTLSIDLIPGEIIELERLEVRYSDDVIFALIEDFEPNRERAFTDVLVGENEIALTTSGVRSGQASGLIELSPDAPIFEAITAQSFDDLVGQIGQVWLEVDFRSDVPGLFGVATTTGVGNELGRLYDPGFVPRQEWTKIYFNLTGVIVESRLTEYKFAITTFLNDLEQESGALYLDNIKVLYF
jgi:hypothetical protein